MAPISFPTLPELAQQFRTELAKKKFLLLYAYNGTGKTRLSAAFKELGKKTTHRPFTVSDSVGQPLTITETGSDTLYFNAFTEDLFNWDNDLQNDRERVLKINHDSRFFAGLGELEMDNRIRPLLNRYADFDFRIDTTKWEVSFSREVEVDGVRTLVEDIKVSRGEENIFIWCFFLAIVQLVVDGAEAYKWVKYAYIDDPISSLDENNAVMVAHHLAQMLAASPQQLKAVISTHHVLFFNVLCNELKKSYKYFLTRNASGGFLLSETDSTPFLYHLSSLVELHQVMQSGALYTHHFNMLRRVMEQTACFFGYAKWEECIKPEADDPNHTGYKRVIDLMSHGDYSLYEPREMLPENKEHLGRALRQFISTHPFSPTLFGHAP
ncbi:AAA family ATPase [Aeromonas salmonicida]|uniref:AAA family ATPase n=1 Tax=Aeromonas TaxID=642 RepID=UPI000F7869A1|nr:AAA family ATPase [Aeromonas salmonicida]MBP8772146.1 AAA family ATPase [Aeromonadaceae bacterium]RSM22694.1 anticodon nuclease [Aeromonas salmonicida]